MHVELVKLIINPNISNQTCFLCFKQHHILHNIHSDIIIVQDHQKFTVSVSKIVSHLFSLQDTVLEKVCDKCSELIRNMYVLIQKHTLIKHNLMKITENLDKEISFVNESGKNCYLQIPFTVGTSDERDYKKKEFLSINAQKCSKCDMSFESQDQKLEHSKIVHKNTNNAVVCHVCGKSCKSPNGLKSHLNCHKEKQCPYCSKFLKTHSFYKTHVQNHITTKKRKKNQTSYSCHDCNFVSPSKGSLEAHINKVHLDLRPHVCSVCGKGFFKKSHLTEHITIHNKVKTEICEICGDNFVCKKTLLQHLRLHKDLKPYKCNICSKTFVTLGRRSEHVKKKHMEKTECCSICNKMFSLRKELNWHIKKKHSQIYF